MLRADGVLYDSWDGPLANLGASRCTRSSKKMASSCTSWMWAGWVTRWGIPDEAKGVASQERTARRNDCVTWRVCSAPVYGHSNYTRSDAGVERAQAETWRRKTPKWGKSRAGGATSPSERVDQDIGELACAITYPSRPRELRGDHFSTIRGNYVMSQGAIDFAMGIWRRRCLASAPRVIFTISVCVQRQRLLAHRILYWLIFGSGLGVFPGILELQLQWPHVDT